MIRKFFKTNWFSIALGLVLLLAVFRHGWPSFLGGGTKNKHKTEKFTTAGLSDQEKSTMGFVAGSETAQQLQKEISFESAQAFFKRFGQTAETERKKFGVPASVLLACAFINSHGGQHVLAKEANNFFGLSCSEDWDGAKAYAENKCFRQYKTPWESFRDFGIYLTAQDWFAALRKSAGKDSQKWALGLSGKGVVLSTKESELLQEVIETYKLARYDQ